MCRLSARVAGLSAAVVVLSAGSAAWAGSVRASESSLRTSPMCFPESMTREEMMRAVQRFGLLPPSQVEIPAGDPRFASEFWVWNGDPVFVGMSGLAERAVLTYSFPDDGVQWGLTAIDPGSVQGNALSAEFVAAYGSVDFGRELVRQALASWTRFCGVYYREVPDDGSAMDQNWAHLPQRGDIRIGGADVPGSPYLAYNAFPANLSPGVVGGGDMFIDSTGFTLVNFRNPANNYRNFRNVVAHEAGHGLGLYHAVPCTQTKLMEPQIATTFDALTVDEIRGGARSYNDPFAPNHTANSAAYLGNLTPPGPVPGTFGARSWGARNLSLNGAGAVNGTGTDWFQFDTSVDVPNFAVVASPQGGSYQTGQQQGTGCSGTAVQVDAMTVGDLEIEVVDAINGNTWIASVNGPGLVETVIVPVLPAGVYNVRVSDIGPTQGDQVQLYDLSILLGSPEPPVAVAGLDKRCRANEPCWFMGDINSYAIAPGAAIAGYEWDLDGDGVYETPGIAQASFMYPSSGDYTVSLRVFDTNGEMDEDQIRLTIHGGTTLLTSITPDHAYQGRNASIQLSGANFLIPTTLSFSGTGIQVVAFGATDALGTQAGAFLFIDPSTPVGIYDARVTNAEGVDTLVGAIQIRCVGDLNGDNVINFGDLNILLGDYNMVDPGNPADFDGSGTIDFADLNFLLGLFNTTC